jgi:hypothetical protein
MSVYKLDNERRIWGFQNGFAEDPVFLVMTLSLGENFPRIKKKVVPYISGVKRWNKNL